MSDIEHEEPIGSDDEMGKSKTVKSSANDESLVSSQTNRILKTIYELYTAPPETVDNWWDSTTDPSSLDHSIEFMSNILGKKILAPRRKVSVMLIGNHSAGKSSFINWYVGEPVMKTSKAVETKGFTICTQGKTSDGGSINGEGTLRRFPHFKGVEKVPGLLNFVDTVVSTSSKNRFDVVDLIDSPGMIDGENVYPFNIDAAMAHFADKVDMILVFFDPDKQALGYKTMDVVEKLNKKYSSKLHYYLTLVDTVDSLIDLFKVSQQVMSRLAPRLNSSHGFCCFPIYLPTADGVRDNEEKKPYLPGLNQIHDLCKDMEKAVKDRVQHNLGTLDRDLDELTALAKQQIETNDGASSLKRNRTISLACSGLMVMMLVMLLALYWLKFIDDLVMGGEVSRSLPAVHSASAILQKFTFLPTLLTLLIVAFSITFMVTQWLASRVKVMTKADVELRKSFLVTLSQMKEYKEALTNKWDKSIFKEEFEDLSKAESKRK